MARERETEERRPMDKPAGYGAEAEQGLKTGRPERKLRLVNRPRQWTSQNRVDKAQAMDGAG